MPSSVIEWMRYEPGGRSLLIAYRGRRGVYRYFDVDAGEWQAFAGARSKGAFLNREFKHRMHGFVKLAEDAPGLRGGGESSEEGICWPRAQGGYGGAQKRAAS